MVVLSTSLPAGEDPRVTVVRSTAEAVQLLDDEAATSVHADGGQVLTDFLPRPRRRAHHHPRPGRPRPRAPAFHDLPQEVRLVHRGTAGHGAGTVSTRYEVARDARHEG